MKIELNLTSAFTLRKRIKELGRVNEQILAYSKYVVEPEQVDEELEKFENKSVYDTFKLCSKCGDEAYRLQNLIDEHNNKHSGDNNHGSTADYGCDNAAVFSGSRNCCGWLGYASRADRWHYRGLSGVRHNGDGTDY